MRKFNFFHFFKKSHRGYILILVVFFIPIIMMGVKWCLDQATLEQMKITSASNNDSRSYKKCAKESALAVAQKWNPALTYNGQKESMLRIADEVYNNATAESATTSLIGRAIPGLDIHPKYKIKNKGTLFNPIQVTPYGEAQSFTTEGRKIAYTNDQTSDHRVKQCCGSNAPAEPYRRVYFLVKNSKATFETPFCDLVFCVSGSQNIPSFAFDSLYVKPDVHTHTAMSTLANDKNVSSYNTDEMSSTIQIRSTPDDPKLKLSVEGDKIKVQVDSDIADDKVGDVGYAVPAECNVDIILTIPTNAAACNKDNADANSTTAGSPSLVTATAVQTTASKSATASVSGVANMRKAPIYQIAQAYRTFLRDNFEFTRGVQVGLIPYSGKVSLPPEKADTTNNTTCWTENVSSFVWNPTETKVDDRDDYLRGMFLYGTLGKSGTAPTTALTDKTYLWGGYLCPTQHGGYGVLCRNVSIEETHAGNRMYVGDVLSTADPATHKFKRMNYCPCQIGAVNMLNMKCTKDCTQFCHNPYFIVPLTPDVTKIHDLMNAIVPFYDDHNQSNLICIPVTWANNLFQDWAYPKAITASDTEGGGRLSNPKPNSTRKKVLILVVNKPDWFEPCELTYLGFDNDYSEVPMVESDRIDFHTNYSDLTLKYADGSSYDNKIRGQSKILLAETDAGVVYNNDTKYYECDEGTVTLKFPRKALVKVVVEPIIYNGIKWKGLGKIFTDGDYNYRGVMGWDGSKFLVYSKGDETFNVMTSKDGEHWEKSTVQGRSLGWLYPVFGGGRWVSQDYYNTCVYENGNWQCHDNDHTAENGKNSPFQGGAIAYGNGMFMGVDVGWRGYGEIHVSSTGDFWTKNTSNYYNSDALYRLSSYSDNHYSLAYLDGKWYSLMRNGKIATSTNDGKSWSIFSEGPSTVSGGTKDWYGIIEAFGCFWATTTSDNGLVIVSSDKGQTWEDAGVRLNSFGGSSYRGLGTNGNIIIFKSDDGYLVTGKFNPDKTIRFSNIVAGSLTDVNEYPITERREFYIEPNQIGNTQDADKNYQITISLENIRLISAEITNRPYEVKTIQEEVEDIEIRKTPANINWEGTLEGTGEGAITTDAPFAIKINVEPIPGMVLNDYPNVTSDRVGLDLYYANGNFIQIKKDTETDKYRIWKSSDMQNWEDVCDAPLKGYDVIIYSGDKYISCNFANTPKYVTSSDLENWSPVQTIPNFSTGPSTISYWSYGDKIYVTSAGNNNLLVTENGGTSWKALTKGWRDNQNINSLIVIGETMMAYAYDSRSSDKCLFISSDGGNSWVESSISNTPYDCVCVNGKFWGRYNGKLYTSSDGKTWEERFYADKNSVTVSKLISADDKIIVVGSDGKVYNASESSEFKTIEFPDLSQSHTMAKREEFIFQANQLKKISDDEYRLNFKITNCKVISKEFVSPADAMKEEKVVVKKLVDKEILIFTKLRTPEKSRVADFSANPITLDRDITIGEKNYRVYNDTTKYWETDRSGENADRNGYVNCGFNISEFRGDFYFLIEDIGNVRPLMRLFNRSKGPNTYMNVKCEVYYFGGLHRQYQDYLETREVNYVSFDIDNAPTNTNIRYYMAGFTLPMNSTLYYSYYGGEAHKGEWYKDSNNTEYPDASEAAKNLTKAALAKLTERSDLRIYLIKFRAPAQYKNNMTKKVAAFNYTYLEEYATASGGKVYTIANDSNAEANLAAKLTEIATEIKQFAGYSSAKIEE